jgi:RNA methyltransferase, TrmH family
MNTASQKQLSLLRKLNRKKHREQLGVFLAEGYHTIEQMVTNKKLVVDELFIDLEHEQSAPLQFLLDSGLDADRVYGINKSTIKDISDTEHASGWLAVIQIPASRSLEDLLALNTSAYEQQTVDPIISAANPILLALDEIQDPGNMGTIIRTAVWFGVQGILLGEGCVDMWNPKVVRSTVGASGFVAHTPAKLEEALMECHYQGWNIMLLDGSEGATPLSSQLPSGPKVWVLGNESRGLSTRLKEIPEFTRYRIEQQGKGVESLNAAMAMGIALYRSVNFS